MDNAFDVHARRAKIDEQANGEACRSEIIQALGAVNFIEGFDGFEFDENTLLDEQIRGKLSNDNTVIVNFNAVLLMNG